MGIRIKKIYAIKNNLIHKHVTKSSYKNFVKLKMCNRVQCQLYLLN